MIKNINIIIGKNSNLSKALYVSIDNSILISSQDIVNQFDLIDFSLYENINIMINSFRVSTRLNILDSPVDYINYSIVSTSLVLEYIKNNNLKIRKLIYTSSSSIYGNNILCKEENEYSPLNLHASLKIANEQLVKKFCIENDIDYTITRVFNLFGGDDKFSVISKIIKAYLEDSYLTLTNHGNAIRDYIHIDDVVFVYKKLLHIKSLPIINIGTGIGTSLKNILYFLDLNNISIKYTNIDKDELSISSADISILKTIVKNHQFISVEKYLKNKISVLKDNI